MTKAANMLTGGLPNPMQAFLTGYSRFEYSFKTLQISELILHCFYLQKRE